VIADCLRYRIFRVILYFRKISVNVAMNRYYCAARRMELRQLVG
jgi:hypothetical protein